ncbi:hypothetical protein GGI25_002444 [Coemansia spiralis]|uniref:Mitochondrial cardiolipin hydrolase n=2 Tax=Coemansia TaxID=4863 RepID=A0A9W8KZB0_9FUNG|nr:hypothetical protein BX070DRAFT_251920 [Coemansia spiralis]KAJ1995441.1 hypothetical protein EDC05_000993 [Coemansia umbellata]KAJ2624729.1 hypothetical protein GGI26_001145 [Coemansia sp. RSA 1358]KAJ2678272.1 hypothetical protein GGI25_002444 [Coemansia spiralis]
MSLLDIITACLGGSSSQQSSSGRQAPYLSAEEASSMPLEAFLQRSLECAPSALEQGGAFADIFQRHLQSGADMAHVAQVVRDALMRLASNDTDRATAQWACQLLAQSAQNASGNGYNPPQMHGQSYSQAVGSGGGEWKMQEKKHRPTQTQQQQQQHGNSDVYIRSFFFPSEESFNQLIEFLNSANSTLDICVFNITDNDIARAISNAKKRGVKVRIITDDEQLKCQGSDVERLSEQFDIPFKTDNDPNKFMHSKFAVIDRRAVWVGSYNWTVSARRSNNESVVCTNDPSTAKAFYDEFEKLWMQF